VATRPIQSEWKRKILIIEDEDDQRTLLCEYFEGVGYQVETAADGHEGIARAILAPPDVVLLDLAMPRLDGWYTAKLLRVYPTTRRIPIIACTGVAGDDAATRAVRAGCNVVVRKPYLGSEVEQAINDLLGSETPDEKDDDSDAG
jgi:CheY-like chemotaxis protein